MFQFKVRPTFIGSSEGEISETRMDSHTEWSSGNVLLPVWTTSVEESK